MDRKKQEQEVYEYAYEELKKTVGRELHSLEISALVETVNAIMRRYDLFPVEDEPQRE